MQLELSSRAGIVAGRHPGVLLSGLVAALLAAGGPAAAGVVGTGTPASCTASALGAEIAAGGTVTFSCGGAATISVRGMAISTMTPVVVDGGGLITLDGTGGSGGILNVYGGKTELPRVTLRNLTFANGVHSTGIVAGGAIYTNGILTLENVTFTGNTAPFGGALSQQACSACLEPTTVVRGCTFQGNAGSTTGGAIHVGGGVVSVYDSTFSGNGGRAPGLYAYLNSGQTRTVVSISGSSFTGNADTGGTGVLEINGLGAGGSFSVVNSTFSGNTTTGTSGPPVSVIKGGGATTTLSNLTIAGNGAPAGGAALRLSNGTVVRNTILAGNTPGNCTPNLTPGAGSGGNLQWGDNSCPGFASADPLLGALANNGGPTRTILPGAGSPALDAIPRADCPTGKDQRGWLRPAGAGCDLGAVEVQAGGARTFVPVVLSAPGRNGSFFSSELTLTNLGAGSVTISLDYTAFAGGGSGTLADALTLAPRAQTVIADAVEFLRGRGLPIPLDGARAGTLGVTFGGLESSADASVTVRTATPVPPIGRAGLAYAGIPSGRLLSGPVALCGLREGTSDRSNVAVQNAGSEGEITLRLKVYLGDPASATPAGTTDLTLGPGGFEQRSLAELAPSASGKDAFVTVERIAGTAPFGAYGVINDNPTSDGSFVDPVELGGNPAGLTLPVVVETGTYDTELVVTNTSGEARTVRATLSADPIPAGSASVNITVPAHGQKLLPRFVDVLRQANPVGAVPAGAGYAAPLALTALEGGSLAGISVSARVGNPAPSGDGRFGLYFGAVPFGRSATDTVRVSGLLQDATNRSNLALVNTGEAGGDPIELEVALSDGMTGQAVATERYEVAAHRIVQIGKVLSALAPGTMQGYVRVRRVRGTNPFLVYGVVNDGAEPGERSGDGAFLPAQE
ncbi:MAG: hypothetical protein IPP07_20740 [Holophagales bacterium]|nr:hypothetical protein [Holophagales bacterium]MBK9967173.1 hypothetical protein [Holophagales bacterium]